MSECTNGEMRDLLPELVNGRLVAELQLAVEAHVAGCAECADEVTLLRSLRPALMSAPVIDTRRIAAAVRAQTAASSQRGPARRRGAPWRLAIAAAALVAVGASAYVVVTRGRAVPPQQVAVAAPTAQPPAASGGVLDNLSDLSDDDVRTLTASLDGMSAVPNVQPAPEVDPLGASLDENSSGGT